MRFTFDPSALLALAATRSTDETRPILHNVHLIPSGLGEATDGHKLLWCREAITEVEDMSEGGILLAVSPALVKLAKAARKKGYGLAFVQDGNGFMATMNGSETVPLLPPQEGTFPNTSHAYPKGETTSEPVAFASNVTAWLAEVGELSVGPRSGHHKTRLHLTGTERAALVMFTRPDWLGVVMPMRQEDFPAAPESYAAWLANEALATAEATP